MTTALTRPRAPAATLRAYGYKRVSTGEQAKADRNSLPEQTAHIAAHCAQNGYALVGEFVDVATGKKDARREYLRMLKSALDGNADLVVVRWLDRFGRNPREILRRVWELQEAGVTVEATDEDLREEMMLLVKAGMAGAESKRNSERVKGNMAAAARKGAHFGRVPYGFRRMRQPDDTIVYVQDEAEAPAVRAMYRMAVVEGLGSKAIADRLGGYPARAAGRWRADVVRKIMRNPSLVGDLVYRADDGDVVIPGKFDAILTRDEWDTLQARLDLRSGTVVGKALSTEYLLSGIARCGHCGGPMVGKRSWQRRDRHGNVRTYRNYWCGNAQRGKDLCQIYNGHSAVKLERAVLGALAPYAEPDLVRDLLDEQVQRTTPTVADELKRVDARLAALDKDFDDNLSLLKRGLLDDEDFARANRNGKDERASLTARRAELEHQARDASAHAALVAKLPTLVGDFVRDVGSKDVLAAKAQLASFVETIVVFNDGRVDVNFRT